LSIADTAFDQPAILRACAGRELNYFCQHELQVSKEPGALGIIGCR
jgi:hypothetical protein